MDVEEYQSFAEARYHRLVQDTRVLQKRQQPLSQGDAMNVAATMQLVELMDQLGEQEYNHHSIRYKQFEKFRQELSDKVSTSPKKNRFEINAISVMIGMLCGIGIGMMIGFVTVM